MDVDTFAVLRDTGDIFDASDVCQGPSAVPETFEIFSDLLVDGDVSRKPVSKTSAETEEILKSTDQTVCIPPSLVLKLTNIDERKRSTKFSC